MPYEKVLSILYSGISTGYGYDPFPDKIMTGRINSGKIKAVINPPKGGADPFKSRVNGTINRDQAQTKIELRISLGWAIIAIYIVWYPLLLFILLGLFCFFEDPDKSIATFLILIILALFPLMLGKLKLNWDKNRLENWMRQKIKNQP